MSVKWVALRLCSTKNG